jgi:hypothetical protein
MALNKNTVTTFITGGGIIKNVWQIFQAVFPYGRIFSQITKRDIKKCPWPEKISGRKITKFCKQVAEERPENIFTIN